MTAYTDDRVGTIGSGRETLGDMPGPWALKKQLDEGLPVSEAVAKLDKAIAIVEGWDKEIRHVVDELRRRLTEAEREFSKKDLLLKDLRRKRRKVARG